MKIGIAVDNTIPLHLPLFIDFMGAHAKVINCHKISSTLRFSQQAINYTIEVANLNNSIKKELEDHDLTFLVTAIPFENNFFYIGSDRVAIVSFSNWHMLTTLSISNGLAYMICQFIVQHVMDIGEPHEYNTGCINDFLWNKTGIDVCMRAAFICDKCRSKSANNPYIASKEFVDIVSILNAVSIASRSGKDILNESTDVGVTGITQKSAFLCHNSNDKPAVRRLNEALRNAGVNTWFDEEQIRPGDIWQNELEAAISTIGACVVIVGDSGVGPWQDIERRCFIAEFANRRCKVIPVLIGKPERTPELPLFLRQFMWLDLRGDDGVNLGSLISALRV